MEEKKLIPEKDKKGNDVFMGDIFPISLCSLKLQFCNVKVVKDDTELGYDVEDANGDRIWNPFSIVHNREKIGNIKDNRELFLNKKKLQV